MHPAQSLRRALRALTPAPLRELIARRRIACTAEDSIAQTFDRIYREGRWAQDASSESGGGSAGVAADAYVALLEAFIARERIGSIVDIGCGDFQIGARIAPRVNVYTALDVSSEIIARNLVRHRSMPNVVFRVHDAVVAPLPRADLVTVRQVFQHLTNAQIGAILANIEQSGARHLLVTEHVPDPLARPNRDLPNQTAATRVAFGSGVDITMPPFSREAELIATIALPAHLASDRGAREVLRVHWRRCDPART